MRDISRYQGEEVKAQAQVSVLYPWYVARHNPPAIEDLTMAFILQYGEFVIFVSVN
jgi:hypothetical protein